MTPIHLFRGVANERSYKSIVFSPNRNPYSYFGCDSDSTSFSHQEMPSGPDSEPHTEFVNNQYKNVPPISNRLLPDLFNYSFCTHTPESMKIQEKRQNESQVSTKPYHVSNHNTEDSNIDGWDSLLP